MKVSAQGRENRNARGLATARAIEREAVRLAALHGADNVTVDQISAAVGVSQRTFFHHFDTKEDALLGLALPRVDEARARAYLSDPDIGILTGLLGLVELPAEHTDDPATMMQRFAVLGGSPALAQRQMTRMMALAGEVEELVMLKLGGVSDGIDPARVRIAAHTITMMAASLMLPPPGTPLVGDRPLPMATGADALRDLDWIWQRLL